MEAYMQVVLTLLAAIAAVAYVVHDRWFDCHVWAGSSREELERIMRRNHDERMNKERDEDHKSFNNDHEIGPNVMPSKIHVDQEMRIPERTR